jgi:predicted amidophosphoribosyltransferase
MNLFKYGRFTSHSGVTLPFKIDCDALEDEDLETLARVVATRFEFSKVIGVPRGGLRFAEFLDPHIRTNGPILIVDDVLTTGRSMQEMWLKVAKDQYDTIGIVIFARGPHPAWIKPIFYLNDLISQ